MSRNSEKRLFPGIVRSFPKDQPILSFSKDVSTKPIVESLDDVLAEFGIDTTDNSYYKAAVSLNDNPTEKNKKD